MSDLPWEVVSDLWLKACKQRRWSLGRDITREADTRQGRTTGLSGPVT